MKVDDDRLVPELVGAVVDPVAAIDDDLAADVEVILEYLAHLPLRALRALVAAVTVRLDPVEHEAVAPRTVDLVQSILANNNFAQQNMTAVIVHHNHKLMAILDASKNLVDN